MNSERETSPRPGSRFRRPLALGLLASVALHAVLAVVWRGAVLPAPGHPAAARTAAHETRGTERALRAVDVRTPARRLPRPPAPVEVSAAVDVRMPSAAESSLPRGELERPDGAGPGPPGRAGDDGRAAVRPPVPRSVLPEWEAPEEVRGRSVTVRVHVDSTGAPTGAVELLPPTPDEAFNRRLVRKVRAMRFTPARDPRGRPLAAWAELTFTF